MPDSLPVAWHLRLESVPHVLVVTAPALRDVPGRLGEAGRGPPQGAGQGGRGWGGQAGRHIAGW